MTDRPITDMKTTDFLTIVDKYIERETGEMGEVAPALFYEALENIYAPPVPALIELEGKIVDERLQLHPFSNLLNVRVKNNEILVDNTRIIIRLSPNKQPA